MSATVNRCERSWTYSAVGRVSNAGDEELDLIGGVLLGHGDECLDCGRVRMNRKHKLENSNVLKERKQKESKEKTHDRWMRCCG